LPAKSQSHPPLRGRKPLRQRAREAASHLRRKCQWLMPEALGGIEKPRPIVVLTTSRSGSTWVCELLSRGAWADPIPEHFRPEHSAWAKQLGSDASDLAGLFAAIARQLDRGVCGGTKLIWDDLPDFPTLARATDCKQLLAPLLELSPLMVRLRRRDPISQAISRYRSATSGVYHQWDAGSAPQCPETASIEPHYDFDSILHHLEVLQRAENHLDALWELIDDDKYSLEYEQTRADVGTHLLPILTAATNRPAELVEARLQHVLRASHLRAADSGIAREWAERFTKELSP
jgi:LPS sulfotransferase NodH